MAILNWCWLVALCWNSKSPYSSPLRSLYEKPSNRPKETSENPLISTGAPQAPSFRVNLTEARLFYEQHGQRLRSILNNDNDKNNDDIVDLPRATLNTNWNVTAANLFYKNHLENILALVNETAALVWDARNKLETSRFGPFKDKLDNLYVVPTEERHPNLKTSQFFIWPDLCQAATAFHQYHWNHKNPALPHVSVVALDENWGEFSTPVTGFKTAQWPGALQRWLWRGCTEQAIRQYMDHPDTRAVVTTQFQTLDHPKVHSLPLGVKSWQDLQGLLEELRGSPPQITSRPKLLMINARPRSMRAQSIDTVIQTFQEHGGVTLHNTYGRRTKRYLKELRHSKFILSPGGMGLDCYRHWEALYMGTIPVLEHLNRTDGWFRSLSRLPVAWIDSYDNLTPQWLEAEYERIIQPTNNYSYQKLTKQWWFDMIRASLE